MSISHPAEEDRLTASYLWVEIWRRRRVIWQSTAAIVLLACAYMWISPASYTATALVSPAQSNGTVAGSTSTLSALIPSLAGLSSGSTAAAATPFDTFMQLILSPRVAADLIKSDPTILPTIFPAEWDKQTKTWHPSYSPIQVGKRLFSLAFGLDPWEPPSAQRLGDYLLAHIVVAPVGTSASMQQITFTFPSSRFAQSFLKRVLDDADDDIRAEALNRSEKQIAYLRNELRTTQELDYRAALIALLSQQEMTRMTINKGLPYAATRVQPPYVSDLPTSPNPILLLAVAVFVGVVVGIFIALVLAVWAPHTEPKSISHYLRSLWARWFSTSRHISGEHSTRYGS